MKKNRVIQSRPGGLMILGRFVPTETLKTVCELSDPELRLNDSRIAERVGLPVKVVSCLLGMLTEEQWQQVEADQQTRERVHLSMSRRPSYFHHGQWKVQDNGDKERDACAIETHFDDNPGTPEIRANVMPWNRPDPDYHEVRSGRVKTDVEKGRVWDAERRRYVWPHPQKKTPTLEGIGVGV